MKRTAILAAALLVGFSPAAMAADYGKQHRHIQSQQWQQRNDGPNRRAYQPAYQQDHGASRIGRDGRRDWAPAPRHRGVQRPLPGRALSPAQLRRLPPLPHGQRYRVVNQRVVRVDNNSSEILAMIGLFSILLGTR